MAVKHKTIINKFPEMTKQLDLLNGEGVEVGVFNGEHKWLAPIHEYGMAIKVTPKMRRYLWGKGLKVGKVVRIPERSFLRTGYDKNIDDVAKKAGLLLADVAGGKTTARGCYQAVGIALSSKIKDYAVNLNSPPNHPFTVEQKGSSNPLVGKAGDMIDGISWRKAK